ncbi:MAG: DUF6508 domain-containing protein [Phycisphaerales bacterium]|nr:DUF6508 domain-containing protein [Phycisphaerales bacterium]
MPDESNSPFTEQERLQALASYKGREEEFSFVQMCYDYKWVQPFDWVEWKETDEAAQLRDDPDVLARATPLQLQHLLTVIFRQDRFAEGSAAEHFESGLIGRIVHRAEVLAQP